MLVTNENIKIVHVLTFRHRCMPWPRLQAARASLWLCFKLALVGTIYVPKDGSTGAHTVDLLLRNDQLLHKLLHVTRQLPEAALLALNNWCRARAWALWAVCVAPWKTSPLTITAYEVHVNHCVVLLVSTTHCLLAKGPTAR